MDFLTIQGLNKSFGGLKAVRNLDITVNEGEIIGLIGPNGSGKTTTLNLLTGFLKPDSGKITLMGQDITGLQRYQFCQKGLARTFQIIKPFLEFTALQNVVVGRVYGQEPTNSMKVAEEEAKEILNQIGLSKKINTLAKDLSLMQRKKLELARALATKPRLLLLDELMAGLNHTEAEQAMVLIQKIRESKITILMVEHIVKAICGLSDRIVVLNMGEKIAEGTPDEILHNQEVIDVYLGKAHA
jgi:branched-chain amino acid transport system ATP-binding protein